MRALVLTTVAATLATSSSRKVTWPMDIDWEPQHVTCHRRLPDALLTIDGINLAAATDPFEDARHRFGEGLPGGGGDAASGHSTLCWSAANGDGTLLVLVQWEIPTEFRVLGPEVAFPNRDQCPKSALVHAGLAVGGIHLGMSHAEAARILGAKLHKHGDAFIRVCESEREMSAQERANMNAPVGEKWSQSSEFTIVEKNGRVVAFGAMWSEVD